MKTKFIHVGKRTLSVVLSIMMIVSTMLIGTITANAATNVTIYFTPNSDWLNSGYDIKADIKYGGGNNEWLLSKAATDTRKTIDSNKVYSVSFNLEHGGLYILKLEARDSSNNWIAETILYNNTNKWYPADEFNGKYWNGSSWVDPSWDSGGSTSVAPAEILSGEKVMFYITSYQGSGSLGLNKGTEAHIAVDKVLVNDSSKGGYIGYITLTTAQKAEYDRITNNGTSWSEAPQVTEIHGAGGGEHFKGNSSPNVDAIKGTTTFADSKTEFIQGTDTSTTLTTTFSSGTKSSYGDLPLYVQYYVDDNLVNSDQLAAASSTNYSLDLTSYSVGPHTLKTVLTDGNIYYLSGDSITFTIKEASVTTTDYFVAGSGTLCGNSWDPGDTNNKMTKNEEDGTYSKTYNDVNSGSYEFKITDGYKPGSNSWNNSWGWNENNKPTITGGIDSTIGNNGDNVKFTITAKSDITITFYPNTKNISVTVVSKTQTFSVKFAAGTAYTSYGSVTANNDTTGLSITSGSNVNSGNKVTFTATPNNPSAYTVGGWYNDASCNSKIESAGTSTTYTINSVTANTEVYVKFVPVSISTTNYYIVGRFKTSTHQINWSTEDTIKFDKYSDTLYKLDTGRTLEQLSAQISGADPVFAIKAVTESGSKFYGTNSDTNITDPTRVSLINVTKIDGHCMKFNLASDTNTNPVTLCLDVTKPDAPVFYYEVVADTEKYSVKMEQGISTPRTKKPMGSSYLDNVSTQTTVTKSIEDLTVAFTTQTTDVSTDETTLVYKGKYMYQVYGYSINMTLNDGTRRVASVVNSLVDSNSAKPISALANGIYTCEYTFPSNISSATVTPIFSVSADYAKAKGISYTAVYLKMTPGSNLLDNATEPKYYTWRAKADGDNKPTPYLVGDKKLEREPEGAYDGQKMLYIGNDMYVAYVQSDLYGILFDNGTPQTFDYNEFIKLQKLGYNNITFEPKSNSSETVADAIQNEYNNNSKVVKTYTTDEQAANSEVSITETNINDEFILDVDIEGYYIDVFGNKLVDGNGDPVKRSDFIATLSDTSVYGELSALLAKIEKSNELFGARWGDYSRPDSDYGMNYCVINYYVDGQSKKLISQQISGYGTIEGARSPKNSSKTNAEYQASLSTSDRLNYYDDSTDQTQKKYFTSGYELIPKTYKGVPYLVSYKSTVNNRIDGKWYYMNTTPQVTVNVKTSLLNDKGSLDMDDGKIVENKTPGTATVNYKSFDTIDQGTSAVMRATPNEGFAFVGFYEENGDFISKYNPYGNKVFAVDTTVYAVFKEVADGSVTITNSPYDSALSNPTPGGGTGKISVTLVITPWDHDDEQRNPVYGKPVSYTGETSVSAPIKDGDKFHIILTGERSGADNFLAFRMPDKDFVGNLYYVALDDAQFLNVKKDPNGKAVSATYETADMVWNWTEQLGTTVTPETKRAKTFSYYTDFSKTDINATLEYRYKDRFGNWKTYIVKNVPMDVSQINKGNYVPDNNLVLQYAPPIDEVFNSCSWKAADIDARNSYALLEADQTYKTFNTYVDRNADGKYSLEEKDNERIVAQFNESIQIEAPETKGNATFKYWKRYLLDSTGDKSGSGEIFSNMRSISIKVTFDSVFEPVYDEVFDTYFTNVQDAKYTREKSTDDKGVVYDYVYADFLLQFDTLEGNDTFKNIVASNPGKIKFGVILEMDYNYTYKPTAEKPGFTAPTTDNDLLKETIKNLNTGLAEGGHNSGWNVTSNSQLAQYNYYYNLYDLTDKASNLSNFGRYDYFFKFANTEANRARVYNVYSYIIIYNDNNQIDQIIVSNPKTLSIYATGIKNDGSTSEKIDTTESV